MKAFFLVLVVIALASCSTDSKFAQGEMPKADQSSAQANDASIEKWSLDFEISQAN